MNMVSEISSLALLIAMAINIMPADIDTITVSVPDKEEAMSFSLLKDGGWAPTDLKGQEPAVLYVDGTQLTVKHSDGEQTVDLLEEFCLEEGTKLGDVTKIEFRRRTVTIKKHKDGIDYVTKWVKEDGNEEAVVIEMRWSKKAE